MIWSHHDTALLPASCVRDCKGIGKDLTSYERVDLFLQLFLTLALDENEGLASRTGRFNPRETVSDTNCMGLWVSLSTVLEAWG